MNLRKYKDYTILEEQRRMFELMGVESPNLTEQRSRYRQGKTTTFRLGKNKVKVGPGKTDEDFTLVVTNRYQFDPENLKTTDMVFETIKEYLPISKKYPNLRPEQIVFSTSRDGKKRDVYTFKIVEKDSTPKEIEDAKREAQRIIDRFSLSDINNLDVEDSDNVGVEPMLFTPPVKNSDDKKTEPTRADKDECPLDPNGPLLLKGRKGDRVKILQLMLMDCGYKLDKFGADGDFGNETDEAVREYQENNGLVVDGKAGPNTINSLCQCQTELGSDVWEDSKYDNLKDELQQREKKEEPKQTETPQQEPKPEESTTNDSGKITDPNWPDEYACVLRIKGLNKSTNTDGSSRYWMGNREDGFISFYGNGVYFWDGKRNEYDCSDIEKMEELIPELFHSK